MDPSCVCTSDSNSSKASSEQMDGKLARDVAHYRAFVSRPGRKLKHIDEHFQIEHFIQGDGVDEPEVTVRRVRARTPCVFKYAKSFKWCRRMRHEVRVHQELDRLQRSEHIQRFLPIIGSFSTLQCTLILTPFMDLGTLGDYLRSNATLTISQLHHHCVEALRTLSKLHEWNYAHCDCHESNWLLTADDTNDANDTKNERFALLLFDFDECHHRDEFVSHSDYKVMTLRDKVMFLANCADPLRERRDLCAALDAWCHQVCADRDSPLFHPVRCERTQPAVFERMAVRTARQHLNYLNRAFKRQAKKGTVRAIQLKRGLCAYV